MGARSFSFNELLPREHGAWVMLVVPLLVGIGAAWETVMARGSAELVELGLFAITVLMFFLLRYPLMLAILARAPGRRARAIRWSLVCGVLVTVGGGVLLAVTRLVLLIPVGALGLFSLAAYLWLAARRAEMSVWGEWTGIAGLALGAPGAYLVATRTLDWTAFALYALNVLYFCGTVLYVRFKVREQPRVVQRTAGWGARLWAGRSTLLYHAAATGIVAVSAALGIFPALALVAFVPSMCKAAGGVLTRPVRLNIRRVGFVELGLTTVFALFVLLAYR